MPISGPDLKSERRVAGVTVVDVAARLGRSRQAVHGLERAAILTVDQVAQYRRALGDAIVASKENVA